MGGFVDLGLTVQVSGSEFLAAPRLDHDECFLSTPQGHPVIASLPFTLPWVVKKNSVILGSGRLT